MAKMNMIDASAGPRYLPHVLNALLTSGARRATKFVRKDLVVTVTQRRERGKLPKRGTLDFSVKIGRPNFSEREFIHSCRKAGEPFPVKKIRLTFPAQ
jgi:hypothetical protein